MYYFLNNQDFDERAVQFFFDELCSLAKGHLGSRKLSALIGNCMQLLVESKLDICTVAVTMHILH